jgi:Na+/proline symporter
MGALSWIDLSIIGAFLVFSFAVGLFVKDKASEGGVEGFFTAGRSMKWWMLGTSIVATTFASDTPLAITGWIAKYGIAGNWFWWGGVFGTVCMTVFFARKWRTSGVVTDVELSELRYGGKPAAVLRTVKAAISSTLVNCIILGWVLAGMAKISEPFMDWKSWLGGGFYGIVESFPSFLQFNSVDNTITLYILIIVTVVYSTIGGLRAVIITDLVQFVMAMGMSIFLAWAAVNYIGGLEKTWAGLEQLYPAGEETKSLSGEVYLTHEQVSAFIPDFDIEQNEAGEYGKYDDNGIWKKVAGAMGFPMIAFVLTMGMLWWTNGNVDGSGYLAQRLYTAKDGGQAEKGALWYGVANFMLRSWPWAITGVAALVIFPRSEVDKVARDFTMCANDKKFCNEKMATCLEDRYKCEIEEYGVMFASKGTLAEYGATPFSIADRSNKKALLAGIDEEISAAKALPVIDAAAVAVTSNESLAGQDIVPVVDPIAAKQAKIVALEEKKANVVAMFKEVTVFKEDRERSYPALIKKVLPIGLIGLAIASLMAAFMSTVSTHINWGASYIANDFYFRFINPKASEKQLTFVSRLSTFGIAFVAIYAGKFIDNIGAAWEFYGAMMAGLGIPHLLRWLWWRANAWTELTGMIVGVVLAIINFFGKQSGAVSVLPESMASHPIVWICWVSLISGIAAIVATMLTAKVPDELIQKFVAKVRPMGFWKGYTSNYSSERSLKESLLYFATGSAGIYAGMFGLGYLLRLEIVIGIVLLVIFAGLMFFTVKGMDKVDQKRKA